MSPNNDEDAERVSFTELMALERIDATTFRSIARPYAPGNGNRAFGGHVYAQAVYAAAQTVGEGFLVHVCRCHPPTSPMHAVFFSPIDMFILWA